MSVTCSMCGRQSLDPEFCDYCNADLGKASQNLPPEICPLSSGAVPLSLEQRHRLLSPESSVVLTVDGDDSRVHWISEYDWRDRGAELEKRASMRLAPLPVGEFVEDSKGRWLI